MNKNNINTFDEYETPLYALRDLMNHWTFTESPLIYEPFVGSGHSTRALQSLGYEVLSPGGDFFKHPAPAPDTYLVSNPPFSIKKKILERIFLEWNHPKVALLLPSNVVQTDYFQQITQGMNLDILMPTARIKFIKDGTMMPKTAGFSCVWVCRGFPVYRGIQMHYLGHTGNKDP